MTALLTIQYSGTAPPVPPTITSTSPLPSATSGVTYTYTFTATSGSPPYTWVAGSGVPAGLTLSSAGVLSGTPTATGSTSFSVTVTDSASQTASSNFSITIAAATGTTWANNQVITVGLPASGLSSFGTKKASTPDIWDYGQSPVGSFYPGYSAVSPNGLTGVNAYANTCNRRTPFNPPGNVTYTVNGPDPYTPVVIGGCHFAYSGESLPNGDLGGTYTGMNQSFTWFWQPDLTVPVYQVQEWYFQANPDRMYKVGAWEYGHFYGTCNAGDTTVTGLSPADAAAVNIQTFTPKQAQIWGVTGWGTSINVMTVNVAAGSFTIDTPAPTTVNTSTFYTYCLGADNNYKTADFGQGPSTGNIYNNTNDSTYEVVVWNIGEGAGGKYVGLNMPNSAMGAAPTGAPYYPCTLSTCKYQMPGFTGSPFGIHGTGPNPNGSYAMSFYQFNPGDPRNQVNGNTVGWVKMTAITCWNTDVANGWRHVYCNNKLVSNYYGQTYWQASQGNVPVAPQGMLESLGGYDRNCGLGLQNVYYNCPLTTPTRSQWKFHARHGLDRQTSGTGHFVLSNNSAWARGDGTHGETQFGWTSWSTTSVTLNLYVGNVNPGPAYLFFADEVAGTSTLVASGTVVTPWLTFDYYISSTGIDTNTGTLASPWSLNALNTKQSTYAGKKVGIVAGTYNCAAIVGGTYSGTFDTPAFNIACGTAASQTYIASCDTSGYYSARAAILDGQMTAANNVNGQPLIGTIGNGAGGGVAAAGYITLDGLEIKNGEER